MNLLRLTASVLLATGCFAMLIPTIALAEGPVAKQAGAGTANTKGQPLAPQNEIIVSARKERLRELTRDVANSEDAFFDAYNHVNTMPEFAVHCSVETPLGTLISRRECTPQFVRSAREQEASNIFDSLMDGGPTQPIRGEGANELINEKYDDYKKHLAAVASSDPGLRKRLNDYAELKKRYNAAVKENRN